MTENSENEPKARATSLRLKFAIGVLALFLPVFACSCSTVKAKWAIVSAGPQVANSQELSISVHPSQSYRYAYPRVIARGPMLLPVFDTSLKPEFDSTPVTLELICVPRTSKTQYSIDFEKTTLIAGDRRFQLTEVIAPQSGLSSITAQTRFRGEVRLVLTFKAAKCGELDKIQLQSIASVEQSTMKINAEFEVECEKEYDLFTLKLFSAGPR